VAVVILIIAACYFYFYFFKNLEIETRFIPSEFEYCGAVINSDDMDYLNIERWLKSNSHGWDTDWNTLIQGNIYRNPAFSVVLFDGGVSVSYKTDNGYPRFIKSVEHGFKLECTHGS